MKASIIIRTYNESKHLPQVLAAVRAQEIDHTEVEIILVDSGSIDDTVSIAEKFGCRIIHIDKENFSFGRSLNRGCADAAGNVLVFISGHCIPANNHWLKKLIAPVEDGTVVWTYGRQVGIAESRFSEEQIFLKYYPAASNVPQDGFFCNNANGALLQKVWQQYRFDEEITGLEDMHLSQQIVQAGMKLGYVSDATVFHIHNESWRKIRNRFEREAIALQHIMPAVHVRFTDFLRYLISSVTLDAGTALRQRVFLKKIREIILYRACQYWGSYRGNHSHRKLSRELKEKYFFPR